jgi:hypothetical protein
VGEATSGGLMEEYERRQKDERLVELINHTEKCDESDDIAGWLDTIPEISEICVSMYDETREVKYRDILSTVLTGIDGMLVDAIRRATIEEKEKFNVIRLKLFRIMKKIE